MFTERKAAQIAAFFLLKRGGRMSHLKLMKLMYLADREAMRDYGFPISDDCAVSMPHGPVLSRTLECIDGNVEPVAGGWESWITDKANHEVALSHQVTSIDDLDEISPAEISVMEKVWQEFGHMTRWQIRDYTHDQCPEWQDPNGSSRPISDQDIFRAVGYDTATAKNLSASLQEQRKLDQLFGSL
ncbi:MAG: hypothetical protein CMI12_15360 [Oceanospirillum sp.]|nr:hypothetical protein [Oceanospirillum sp.]